MSTEKSPAYYRFKKIMIYVLIIYLLLLAGFYYFQHLIFFHPKVLPADYRFRFEQRFVEKEFKPDAQSVTSLIRFLPDDTAKGVVLYFHGNRDNVERYAPYAATFTQRGFECWMPDYPGFGKSTGALTAENIQLQAMQVYLLARSIYPAEQIIVYGKSLGTGPAAYLAGTRPCSRLILESPYYSLASLASRFVPFLPVDWLIKVNFKNNEYLPAVKVPVTIFQGTDDATVPYRNAARLKPFLKPQDRFVTIEGGQHNGLILTSAYQAVMDSLLTH